MKKLFIIDGNSLVNRAFYALPLLSNGGVFSNAVFGFVNCLLKLIVDDKPDYLVVAFDHARKTFRNEIYNDYKGNRKGAPEELKSQFPLLKEILQEMKITCIEKEGIEADDIIGTITKKSGVQNIIITGDRDSLQLINASTKVWLTQRGITDIKEVNAENIKELYSLTPSQVIDYKALAGDSSDNIPGVMGIGEKTALSLISSYGNIDEIYNNTQSLTRGLKEKLENGKEACYMSKQLATIKTDCEFDFDLNGCTYDFPFGIKVKELFKKYNFNAFLKRDIFRVTTNNVVEIVNSATKMREIFKDFNSNYFCFDFKNKFMFAFGGKAYVIEKEISLFDSDPVDINEFLENIIKILNNKNILKITSDIKEHLHMLKLEKIENIFDIKLANYLLLGGGKSEQEVEISEFYQTYQTQIQDLNKKDMTKLYYDIELPLVFVLYNMEKEGFKLNKKILNALAEDYKRELIVIEREILNYSINPNLNIKSSKQLSSFLFEELGLSDKGNKKHSTNVEVLNELVNHHPVIPLILRYRKVQKLYSTYVEPYQKLTENSPLIYTIFNQMTTATGRLSSSEPNLQNIPVRDEEGKVLRKLFVSRFENGKIISADYNQIELRLMANFSKDKNLVSDYTMGADIHRATASQIFNVPISKITDTQRRLAKAVNFGIIYGISAFGLSKNIEVSVRDAQNYIDIYFQKYPKVKEYLDEQINFAKQNGYVKTLYNRVRYVPEINASGMQKTFGERVAMNMPLQGSASDIIKIAMIRVYNAIKNKGLKSKLILQIHDELIVDCAQGEEEIVQQILKQEMQNVYISLVPLLVEVGIGETWFETK